MSPAPTASTLSAEYPLAEVEPVPHWEAPRLSAKIPHGSGYVLVAGKPAEVAAWLMENYRTTTAEAPLDQRASASNCRRGE